MHDASSRPSLPGHLRWLAALAFVLTLVAAGWRLPDRNTTPAFALPPLAASPAAGLISQGMLPGVGSSAASPSLAGLADGRVAIAWRSAATAARQQDAIWFSVFEHGAWRQPFPVSSTEEAAGSLFAHVRQLSEPVLFQHGSALHLWFAVSGAGGRSIVHTRSDDDGESWQGLARVAASPLANTDLRLRHPPLAMADGSLGLPLSQTWLGGHGEWLRLDAAGKVLEKSRMPTASAALDPAVIAIDARQALALLRHPQQAGLQLARSDSAGEHWQGAPAIDLGGSPSALLRLPSGRLLLAGNAGQGRGTLAVWIGSADGSAWQAPRIIETAADARAEFSEPSLAIDGDGRIHLAYAWRGEGIRHLVFGEAWLDGGQP